MVAAGGALFAPGLVLERKYRIVAHLADGGMGAIYEAEHLTIGRRVAVKVLHPELSRKDDIVARFQQEARAASAIGHQNIVDILDLGRAENGAHFLVMELLRGANLAERLVQLGGRVPVPRAAHIIRQVLDALAATHRHGIIHRDLKPENVFLVQRGQDPDFVKVLDFGISKVITDDLPKLSTTGQVLGTPYFMAPEQTRGAATDHRVDIYACGAILYQLVTGRLPFTAPNFNALMFEIAGGRYYPPRALAPDIPAAFETVVQYAMALDPNYRFQTAEHMAQSVAPFAQPVASLAAAGATPVPERRAASLTASVPAPERGMITGAVPAMVAPSRLRLQIAIGVGALVGLIAGLLVIRRMDFAAAREANVLVEVPVASTSRVLTPPPAPPPPPPPAPAKVVARVPDAAPPVAVVPLVAPDAAPAPAPPAEPPVLEMAPEPVARPAPATSAPADAGAALPAQATLQVNVTPADAPGLVVSVDGAPVSGGAISLPTNARKRLRLVVRAKGYDDWTRAIVLTADTVVEVKLSRKSLGDRGPGSVLGL
jgi:tRNA A-37 threonylcarbamoyl transferase component Bud32